MKKLLLITLALLALGATVAAAQDGTMNMAWGAACRNSTNNTGAALNDLANNVGGVLCDDPSDPFSAAPLKTLTCSFKNNKVLPTFAGTSVVIEMLAMDLSGTASDFWAMGTGGANSGALGPKTTLGAVANCTNPFTIAPTDAQNILPSIEYQVDALGKIHQHVLNSRVRSNTQINLPIFASTGGYLADQITIDFALAAGLPGCTAAVCFNLNAVVYGGGSLNYVCDVADLRNWVTYAGGTGTGCPGSTPTKSSTWGAVKALYR